MAEVMWFELEVKKGDEHKNLIETTVAKIVAMADAADILGYSPVKLLIRDYINDDIIITNECEIKVELMTMEWK